jgi:hypothetical protein
VTTKTAAAAAAAAAVGAAAGVAGSDSQSLLGRDVAGSFLARLLGSAAFAAIKCQE